MDIFSRSFLSVLILCTGIPLFSQLSPESLKEQSDRLIARYEDLIAGYPQFRNDYAFSRLAKAAGCREVYKAVGATVEYFHQAKAYAFDQEKLLTACATSGLAESNDPIDYFLTQEPRVLRIVPYAIIRSKRAGLTYYSQLQAIQPLLWERTDIRTLSCRQPGNVRFVDAAFKAEMAFNKRLEQEKKQGTLEIFSRIIAHQQTFTKIFELLEAGERLSFSVKKECAHIFKWNPQLHVESLKKRSINLVPICVQALRKASSNIILTVQEQEQTEKIYQDVLQQAGEISKSVREQASFFAALPKAVQNIVCIINTAHSGRFTSICDQATSEAAQLDAISQELERYREHDLLSDMGVVNMLPLLHQQCEAVNKLFHSSLVHLCASYQENLDLCCKELECRTDAQLKQLEYDYAFLQHITAIAQIGTCSRSFVSQAVISAAEAKVIELLHRSCLQMATHLNIASGKLRDRFNTAQQQWRTLSKPTTPSARQALLKQRIAQTEEYQLIKDEVSTVRDSLVRKIGILIQLIEKILPGMQSEGIHESFQQMARDMLPSVTPEQTCSVLQKLILSSGQAEIDNALNDIEPIRFFFYGAWYEMIIKMSPQWSHASSTTAT